MSNLIALPLSTKLSKYVSLADVVKSQTATRLGINNLPTQEHYNNLVKVSENIFDKIVEHFALKPVISSGYRSNVLNKKIKGSPTSDHCFGRALDIDVDGFKGISNKDIFLYIAQNLNFKQLIWEFGDNNNPAWVHVAFDVNNNRKEILQAVKLKTRTSYKIMDLKNFLKKS